MSKKKYIIVLDSECTIHQFVYDIGWAVIDLHGNVYETEHYVVSEVFFGMIEDMHSAYYAYKIPHYDERLISGDIQDADFDTIRGKIFTTMEYYGINIVAGYNVPFDRRGLNYTISQLSDGFATEFFPQGTIFWDIWGMACETILKTKRYYNTAIMHGWISKAGNILSNAETAFRYISDTEAFEEEHMGLDDALIEATILWATIRTHKKMTRTPISQPWRIIQR